MKNIPKNIGNKSFSQKDRHVRYNWRESPNSTEDRPELRFYFIIQDDKDREGKLQKILEKMQSKVGIQLYFNKAEEFDGKSVGTDYRYLFRSLDTNASYEFLDFSGISKNTKRDFDLRERIKTSLENYVRNIYESKK